MHYFTIYFDFIIITDDSNGDDSSKTHVLSSVANNETLIHGFVEFSQEVDEELASHSTKTLQPVESHHLASSSRGPVISRGSNAVIPRRPYRSQRMRASNDHEVIERRRERQRCAHLPKVRNLLHERLEKISKSESYNYIVYSSFDF
ncbi:hypothetical protein H5410_004404 [Solanum commersonii]|uniref:Uncharacterized protein n=1 Tax=Solanum commersonii TaxID=4109 RepID=A0A9J6B8C4_SOLCO|nr:hypothetical protein H5410_004404 [Solanum commersonii]